LKEYNKKRKKDIGLEFLEYSSFSKSDNEKQDKELELAPVTDIQLEDEYVLPKLPKPLSLYTDCRYQ
jgi:hypothetical protein